MHESLTLLVHGESGVGKTWLADTAPAPRLVLDAEGGIKFTKSRKATWDGHNEPPADDGTWDTCAVRVHTFEMMRRVYQWLNSGKHPFRSVIIDSITELQKKAMDSIAGTAQPTQQDWGALLRQMEHLVRLFRDLADHTVNPLDAVVFTAMSSEKSQKLRPHVQGQLAVTLPYYVDVVGYLYTDTLGDDNAIRRVLLTQPTDRFDAKDRTDQLGVTIVDPNVENMIATIFKHSQ